MNVFSCHLTFICNLVFNSVTVSSPGCTVVSVTSSSPLLWPKELLVLPKAVMNFLVRTPSVQIYKELPQDT